MNNPTIITILSACILGITSCDKPSVTTPTTTTATETKISDPGAAGFLEEYKAFGASVTEAIKSGSMEKIQPLVARGKEMAAKGQVWLSKVKPEEMAAYKAKLAEFSKLIEEQLKKIIPNAEGLKDAALNKLQGLIPPTPAKTPAPDTAPATPAPDGN